VSQHMEYFCSMAAPTADLRQNLWDFSFLHYSPDHALCNVLYSVVSMEILLSRIKKLVSTLILILK
jgi:hypothetical protein